jgi:hypothetical protein
MRYVTVRSYQISFILVLLLAAGILGPIAIALTYMWATRTTTFLVEEPLSITGFPSALSTHPGENKTLNITIENNANIDYSVILNFFLNDTVYQQTYMNFSNTTYTIIPGSNNITAWCKTAKKAPPVQLSLTVEFHRE